MKLQEKSYKQLTIYDYLAELDKVYDVDVRGLCDDAYCPKCGYAFWDREADCEACPECGTKVRWDRWHRLNDEV